MAKYSIKPYVEAKSLNVYFIISYGGKRFHIMTGLKTTVKFDGLMFPRTVPNAAAKTARLTTMYSELEEWLLRHPNEPTTTIKDKLKSIITGEPAEAERNILYFFDKFIQTKVKESTKEIYHTTMGRIERFDKTATFDTINRDWLERYQANELIRGRQLNGIAIDLRNIRTVFNWAIDNDYTDRYPFRKFSIRSERKRYLALSAEEMRQVRDWPCELFLERYRDIFMLGFYLIGINLSDLLELPADCIKNGRIQYRRNKTARLYDIKVEPEAMEIINKYRGKKYLLDILDGGALPKSFGHHLNDSLKKLGEVTTTRNHRGQLVRTYHPLHPDMIWYTARRSWATIAAELDIPKETIGKALGHSEWDNSTTDRYITFNYKKVDEANRRVLDALKCQ